MRIRTCAGILMNLEACVTEIGRRTALIAGVTAFAISTLAGVFTGGDMFMSAMIGMAAGLIFGGGGLLIGNLIENYTFRAAKRELARQALERELEAEIRAQAKAKRAEENAEDAESESDEGEGG
jgi:hypothetical protein